MKNSEAFRAILTAGLVVGAMDITSAIVLTLLHGGTIMRLMQFIASGLLGKSAFQGGLATAALGLALHFVIAFGLVTVFYFASRKLAFLRQRPVPSGIAYGLIVFAVMNLIVGHAPGVVRTLRYRKEFFGHPISELTQQVMRGPSEWTVGERETFAAFVSRLNQCVF